MIDRKIAAVALLLTALSLSAQTPQNANKDAKPAAPAAPTVTYTGGTKLNPEAKSAEENQDYAKLIALQDAEAFAKAATEFAAKYPESNLNGAVFQQSMLLYQQAGNSEKALDAGRKSLHFDDENPLSEAIVAGLIVQGAHATDLDFKDKAKEVLSLANDALANADQLRGAAGHPAEMVNSAKTSLRFEAENALGRIFFLSRNYPQAEAHFQKAVDFFPAEPDPVELYLLALAQRNQDKLVPALATIDKALVAAQAAQQTGLTASLTTLKADTQKALDKQKSATPPPAK
jgi:tetratricopeptide (TPR) repeat protein